MPRARLGEANHVDDDIGPQVADFLAEGPGLFLGVAVENHCAHVFPGAMGLIRRPLPAADRSHFEPSRNQARHEIGADMAASTDDDDAGHGRSPSLSRRAGYPIARRMILSVDDASADLRNSLVLR